MVTAGRAALLMCFEPVWTMVFSLALLGTTVSLTQALGCGTIFLAIVKEVVPKPKASQ